MSTVDLISACWGWQSQVLQRNESGEKAWNFGQNELNSAGFEDKSIWINSKEMFFPILPSGYFLSVDFTGFEKRNVWKNSKRISLPFYLPKGTMGIIWELSSIYENPFILTKENLWELSTIYENHSKILQVT